jgi:hypothetical protein
VNGVVMMTGRNEKIGGGGKQEKRLQIKQEEGVSMHNVSSPYVTSWLIFVFPTLTFY